MAVLLEERTAPDAHNACSPPTTQPTPDPIDNFLFSFPGEPLKGDDLPLHHETAILFDWDDTLLGSTCLAGSGLRVDETCPLPHHIAEELALLEKVVISILKEASKLGHVYLITNAETGWIELSAQRFLPRVLDALNNTGTGHSVRVLSARSTYEDAHPDSPCEWKTQAFVNEMITHDSRFRLNRNRTFNIVSIGDSINERTAAHAIPRRLQNTRIKTIKFVERPSLEQLRKQLDLLLRYLPGICHHSTSFDINLVMD